MTQYNFSLQKELFTLATEILNDYEIGEWSFGGGTALSYLYYQHRMSYDIDIFSDDYSAINLLVENREEIANNLGIPLEQVEASPSAITFIINTEDTGLKLDFIFSPALTSKPYEIRDVFGHTDIKVQTPMEIIAKKMAHREQATIRDFVDYALVEEESQLLTKLKSEGIENIDIDRYLDIVDKFNNFDEKVFNEELKNLLPTKKLTKKDLSPSINNLMTPKDIIKVAVDHKDVIAFDEFTDTYCLFYEEIGGLDVYSIQNRGMTYKDLLKLKRVDILELVNHKKRKGSDPKSKS